jgi:LAO/AO transport system kinase
MQSRTLDSGTFIRSMATRGNLGGLARATADVLLIMDAAGFDLVLIETVGVGQDEVEIARTAQMTLVLFVPGMGDDIQTMKAGIMEIGDLFIINKADHPGVDRIEAELTALLSIAGRPDEIKPSVVRTIASEGKGIEECAQAIRSWYDRQKNSSFRREKEVKIQRARLLDLARSEIQRHLMRTPGVEDKLEILARKLADREVDPFSAAEELLSSWNGKVSHE